MNSTLSDHHLIFKVTGLLLKYDVSAITNASALPQFMSNMKDNLYFKSVIT